MFEASLERVVADMGLLRIISFFMNASQFHVKHHFPKSGLGKQSRLLQIYCKIKCYIFEQSV